MTLSDELKAVADKLNIKIKADFNSNIPKKTIAYALILSDREIQLKWDGSRMHILS